MSKEAKEYSYECTCGWQSCIKPDNMQCPDCRKQVDKSEFRQPMVDNERAGLQHPTRNVPLIALNEAAEKEIFQKEAESCYTTSESNYYRNTDGCNNAEIINEQEAFVNGAEFGANFERSKLPQLIKEVLKRAADGAKIIDFASNYIDHGSIGAQIFEVDKQSILSVFDNCDDLIK